MKKMHIATLLGVVGIVALGYGAMWMMNAKEDMRLAENFDRAAAEAQAEGDTKEAERELSYAADKGASAKMAKTKGGVGMAFGLGLLASAGFVYKSKK